MGSMGYRLCREISSIPIHLINLQVFIKLPLSASTKESCHSLVTLGFSAESLRKWRGS